MDGLKAGLAQQARAVDLYSSGRGFDSLIRLGKFFEDNMLLFDVIG